MKVLKVFALHYLVQKYLFCCRKGYLKSKQPTQKNQTEKGQKFNFSQVHGTRELVIFTFLKKLCFCILCYFSETA